MARKQKNPEQEIPEQEIPGQEIPEPEIPEQEIPRHAYQPTARECAMLLLQLIEAKHTQTGKDVTRTRLSEATLRKLWCRSRLTTEFVHKVQEWLFMSGWVLFFAGTTYAIINVHVVEGWMRISAKRLSTEIGNVRCGKFDFAELEHLLLRTEESEEDSEEDGVAQEGVLSGLCVVMRCAVPARD